MPTIEFIYPILQLKCEPKSCDAVRCSIMNVDPQKIAATISMRLLSNGKNHKNQNVFYNYTMKIIAVSVVYDKYGRPITPGVEELIGMFHAAFENLFAEELKRDVSFVLKLKDTHETELDGATFTSRAWSINSRARVSPLMHRVWRIMQKRFTSDEFILTVEYPDQDSVLLQSTEKTKSKRVNRRKKKKKNIY